MPAYFFFFFNSKGGYYKLAGPVKMQTLIQGVKMQTLDGAQESHLSQAGGDSEYRSRESIPSGSLTRQRGGQLQRQHLELVRLVASWAPTQPLREG